MKLKINSKRWNIMRNKILKALTLCTAKDGDDRKAIKKIYIEPTEDNFNLVATDCYILLKAEYPVVDWTNMVDIVWREYSYTMPDNPTKGLLCFDPKKRDGSGIFEPIDDSVVQNFENIKNGLVYPDYQMIIPTKSDNTKPFFMSYGVMARLRRILKLIGVSTNAWFPDIYGGDLPTVKKIRNFTIVAMPSIKLED